MSLKSNAELSNYYENLEFNLATGSTNVPLSTISTNAGNVYSTTGTFHGKYSVGSTSAPITNRAPSRCFIRTNNTVSISLTPGKQTANPGTAVNDAITIASTDSPFTIEGINFNDILFTNNSGSTAAIKVLIQDAWHG